MRQQRDKEINNTQLQRVVYNDAERIISGSVISSLRSIADILKAGFPDPTKMVDGARMNILDIVRDLCKTAGLTESFISEMSKINPLTADEWAALGLPSRRVRRASRKH